LATSPYTEPHLRWFKYLAPNYKNKSNNPINMDYKYLEQREDGWYVKPKYSEKNIKADDILFKFNICLLTSNTDCAKAYGIEEKIVEEIRKLGQQQRPAKKRA